MSANTITERLGPVREQDYPLEINKDAANALVECIRRIMAAVPEDDQFLVRADYSIATAVLSHPSPVCCTKQPD